MRGRVLITLVMGLVGIGFLVIPSIGSADPKPLLPPAAYHRHFILAPTGERVPVGPDICDDADPSDALKQSFANFHFNVHRGADGLANIEGAEIKSGPC